jgi:hypothetical protein
VKVYSSETDIFTIKTTNENGSALSNVHIVCDEMFNGADIYTNNSGKYDAVVLSGTYTMYFYVDGYEPQKMDVDTTNLKNLNVKLVKNPVVTGELKTRELDYNEIKALGIDTTAPENRQVFAYTVKVKYNTETEEYTVLRNAEGDLITDGELGSGFYETLNFDHDDDGNLDEQFSDSNSNSKEMRNWRPAIPVETEGNGGAPVTQKIKESVVAAVSVQTDITWLKSFYTVELLIINNSSEDFSIEEAGATLNLPTGLSLAETTAENGANKSFGIIKGGESKVVSWTVRGDTAGSYDITADFSGTLEPLGDIINIRFATDQPIIVTGGKALRLDIIHDLWSENNHIWKAEYILTNISENTVNDIQLKVIYQELLDGNPQLTSFVMQDLIIYYNDREDPVVVNWKSDGTPDFENAKWYFNPLLEDIPDETINLDPGKSLSFTINVIKSDNL